MQETVVGLEQAVRELQREVERGKADEGAQAKVVILEGSLSALQEENVRLGMDAKNEEAVSQGLVRKLEGELCTVHTVHLGCDMKVRSRSSPCGHGNQAEVVSPTAAREGRRARAA